MGIPGILMRSETISDKQTRIINRSIYQLDEENRSDMRLDTLTEMDRILRRLDQIEKV